MAAAELEARIERCERLLGMALPHVIVLFPVDGRLRSVRDLHHGVEPDGRFMRADDESDGQFVRRVRRLTAAFVIHVEFVSG